jgi:glycosyltransferase involved in cell wall biosynthesis
MLITTWRAREKYDIAQVDVYSGAAFHWAEWSTRVARAAKKPCILTLHGGNLPEFARNHTGRVAKLLKSAAAVTSPSRYLVDAIQIRCNIRVIPNAIDLDSYFYQERVLLRPKLVWVRAFHQIYDPILAIRALAIIADYIPDAQLTMVGPDKDGTLADARTQAVKLGVLDRVHFTGAVGKSEIPKYLAAADIFLNTSTIDNTPVSVIEAMAMGLTVVSTNVGGIPYLLEDGANALLVSGGDAKEMAAAVMRLLAEPSLAAAISRNGRAKAENFSWDAVLPKWEELLLEVGQRESVGHV